MALSLNKVILVGNSTRDVELRYTPAGTAVADVGLAINERRKDAAGNWVEDTTFVDVTFWGRTAEVASEYLQKGSPVFVEGRLRLDQWEGQDGQKRSKLRVVCEKLQLMGGRATPTTTEEAPDTASPSPANDSDTGGKAQAPGDDIPF